MTYKVVLLVLLAGLAGYAAGVVFHGHDTTNHHFGGSMHNGFMYGSHGTAGHISDEYHSQYQRVMSDTMPSISVQTTKSDDGSYNVRVLTDNFVFIPSMVNNKELMQNQGHAHLYINNKKAGTIYNEWYHIPGNWLNDGNNNLRVSLHANNHKQWSYDGSPVESEFEIVK